MRERKTRVRELISALTKVLEKYGNVEVVKPSGHHPRVQGWYRYGATWKWRENDDDPIVI